MIELVRDYANPNVTIAFMAQVGLLPPQLVGDRNRDKRFSTRFAAHFIRVDSFGF